MSPPPPYSSGKPMPVWPVLAISTTTSLTRSRNSVARQRLGLLEDLGLLGEVGAHEVADLGVPAVEEPGQLGDVEARLPVARAAARPARRRPPRRGGGGARRDGLRGRRGHGLGRHGLTLPTGPGSCGDLDPRSRVRTGVRAGRRSSAGSRRRSTTCADRDAGPRRLDDLAAADVERDVVDRRRAAARAPEHQVTGPQGGERHRAWTARTAPRSSAAGSGRRPPRRAIIRPEQSQASGPAAPQT